MIRSSATSVPVGTPEAAPSAEATRQIVAAIIAQVEASFRHVRCAASERLIREGVSMTHLHVLWQLEEHGELTMGRIAELVGVSLSNASGLIDRMEERGLVERTRLSDDRRVVRVRPTAHGLETARTIEVLRGDLIEAVLARLDEEQLARVALAVADLQAALFAGPHPLVATATGCGSIDTDTHPALATARTDKETAHS